LHKHKFSYLLTYLLEWWPVQFQEHFDNSLSELRNWLICYWFHK